MKRLKRFGGCVAGLLLSVSSSDAALAPSSVVETVKRADKAAIRAMLRKGADVNAREARRIDSPALGRMLGRHGNRRVADSRGGQRQDDEPAWRHAARAGLHERQREDRNLMIAAGVSAKLEEGKPITTVLPEK